MSHFYVLALVPTSVPTGEIEKFIAANMAPYDENLEVPEYDRKCYCIGSVARGEAREHADKAVATIESLRDSFKDIRSAIVSASGEKPTHPWDLTEETDDKVEKAWVAHITPRGDVEQAFFKAHALAEAPRPDCDTCQATGTYKTTYNPESTWDWYRVGGRWDGEATKTKREATSNGGNYGDEHEQLRYNCIAVSEALKSWQPKDAPYAILGPDGKWYAKGKMGWFGMSDDKGELVDWRDEALAILKAHEGDHVMVGLDCHI